VALVCSRRAGRERLDAREGESAGFSAGGSAERQPSSPRRDQERVVRDAKGSFTLETLDAPLVAPGQRALVDFNNNQPDMSEGVHVNLYNNLWGTAFPQWYGEDMKFRFAIRV
jgi:hypothetical protein